jgi:hypothetical protein
LSSAGWGTNPKHDPGGKEADQLGQIFTLLSAMTTGRFTADVDPGSRRIWPMQDPSPSAMVSRPKPTKVGTPAIYTSDLMASPFEFIYIIVNICLAMENR